MTPAAHAAMRQQILIRAIEATMSVSATPAQASEILSMVDAAAPLVSVPVPKRLELVCQEMRR